MALKNIPTQKCESVWRNGRRGNWQVVDSGVVGDRHPFRVLWLTSNSHVLSNLRFESMDDACGAVDALITLRSLGVYE